MPALIASSGKVKNPEYHRIARCRQQVAVELPVLIDYDAAISNGWMFYLYPSSHRVVHQRNAGNAYLSAELWDLTENRNKKSLPGKHKTILIPD